MRQLVLRLSGLRLSGSYDRKAGGRGQVADVLDPEMVATLNDVLSRTELDGLLGRADPQLTILMEAAQQAWQNQNLPAAQAGAHKLASFAGTVGCRQLMAAAQRIEATCRAGEISPLQALFVELHTVAAAARAALQDWRATIGRDVGR